MKTLLLLIFVIGSATHDLKIVGKVDRAKIHTVDSLKTLAQEASIRQTIYCASGELKVPDSTFNGLPLKTILLDAGITTQRRQGNKTFVVLSAPDGFQALFSWAEIMEEQESPVFLAYGQNGGPLPQKQGPYRLISTNDQRNGTRSIFAIEKIAVRELPAINPTFTNELEIVGNINSNSLSLSDLMTRSKAQISNLVVTNSSGEFKEKLSLLEGVDLVRLLQEQGITMDFKKGNRTYISLQATDGYQVLYSWHELMNNKTANQTLVAYLLDGKPLDNRGPFMSISKQNDGYASRQIRWLRRIEVNEAL